MIIVSLLVLLFLPMMAYAEVTATYIRENSITLAISPGPFTSSSVLGAKLGTFVITSTTGEIYSPALVNIGEASGQIPVTGLMKDSVNGPFVMGTNDFYMISVAYPNGLGSEPVLQVLYDNLRPIISWQSNVVYANPFYVELYLVNTNRTNRHAQSLWRRADFFKLDSPYALPSNFNPVFSVAVANSPTTNVGTFTNSDGTVNDSAGSYVTTDGSSGPDNTSILDPGSYTNPDAPGTPGFFYGDVPVVESFVFHFLTPQTSFSLSNAFAANRMKINEAQIQVLNGVQGTLYAQILTFTDTSSNSSFQLFPLVGSTNPIDYNLYLGNDLIDKGVPILWSNLVPGIVNSRDISIGGISEAEVQNKVSGTYQGTITVTITNPN